MSNHRYYRLTVTGSESGTDIEIAALALYVRGGANPTILKNGGTASASATDAGSDPENAFDNDPTTNWLADAAPSQSLKFDFGAGNEQDIVGYAITADDSANTHAPTDWTLEWSDDDSAWTTLDTQTSVSIAAGETATIELNTHKVNGTVTLDEVPEARIVRVYAEDSGDLLGQDTSSDVDGTYEVTFPLPAGTNVIVTCHTDYGKPWAASDTVEADELRTPTTANSHYYSADGAGTTGASEPIWPTDGGTVNDNGITWTDEGEMDAPLIEGPFIPVEV